MTAAVEHEILILLAEFCCHKIQFLLENSKFGVDLVHHPTQIVFV